MNEAITDELKQLNDAVKERLGKVEVALENNISRVLSLEQKNDSAKFLSVLHGTPSSSVISGQNWAILSKSDKVAEAKSVTSPLPFDGSGLDTSFNIGRALRVFATGDSRGSEAELKALGGSGTGSGSFLLPSSVSANYIDNARARSVVTDAGVQTIVFADGAKMVIPRITADVTAAWRAEHGEIGESDPTFDGITVVPKSLAAMCRVSSELLADAPDLAGKMIEASLTGALALGLDAAVLRGPGQNNAPTGIRFTQGVTVTPLVAAVAWDDLSTARGAVLAGNHVPSAIIWAPSVDAFLDIERDVVGGRWLGPSPAVAPIPRYVTSQIPTNLGTGEDESEVYVGDFSQAAVLLRQAIQIEASRDAAFANNQVLVRAILRADVAVFRPGAFVVLTGVTTS